MILVLISALSLAAWLYLVFGRGGYWRRGTAVRGGAPGSWPGVVAVIPARNESESIGPIIASHMASDCPGPFSVILVDDGSEDGTADIAQTAACGGKRSLEIVAGAPLEAGWSGKLWAMNQGIERAKTIAPNARYLLLTDADILHAPSTLRMLVAKAETQNLALASLMARLDARGFWDRCLFRLSFISFSRFIPSRCQTGPKAASLQRREAACWSGAQRSKRRAASRSAGPAHR